MYFSVKSMNGSMSIKITVKAKLNDRIFPVSGGGGLFSESGRRDEIPVPG